MKRVAIYGMICILSLVLIFHLLIIIGVIPFTIVWGGRLTDHASMIRLELVSIGMNLVMLFIAATKAGIVRLKARPVILRAAFWLMFVLFIANTAGNLFAVNILERVIFTPLTLLLALFSLVLALDKEPAGPPASGGR